MSRAPDFIVIGAMKAGTTTLFRWLDSHPDFTLPGMKEPAFFAREDRWKRGLSWYYSLFSDGAKITGEASVAYTDPERSFLAADRIAKTLPGIRLVFVARHPLDRARSHYVHQVQRGREDRTFDEALGSEQNPYTARSQYFSVLRPYIEAFRPEQMAVVWFEELFSDEKQNEWDRLIDFLGAAPVARPVDSHNRSAERTVLSPGGRRLRALGIRFLPRFLPTPVRRFARSMATSGPGSAVRQLILSAETEIGGREIDSMWEDVRRFLVWAGSDPDRWQ